uniref:Uncharacterized protein AlNc14C172G8037 n=1 Tax=Albugo laibachii Nc14 TaxID=890382 RepID=F0WNL4_9STRA|nr:conserved hypothetical protein [Albugo laibachii Nc14]|eukprot:CCA22905.1 conserved hypothetical protein [Albugo laibachii Nc14]
MGMLHAWEVLQALQYFFQRSTLHGINCKSVFDLMEMGWPYPFLQIQFRQALRGLFVLISGFVTASLVLLCAMRSMLGYQNVKVFQCMLMCTFLGLLTLIFVLVRFIVLPTPQKYGPLFSKIRSEYGMLDAVITSSMHACMQIYQGPQLIIVWALSIAYSWVWNWAICYLLNDEFVVPDSMGAIFLGCVSTYLFLTGGMYVDTSPMQANALVTLKGYMQRNFLQSWRYALIGYPSLILLCSLSQYTSTPTWLSCKSYAISTFFELFVQLCATSLLKSSFYRSQALDRKNEVDRKKCWRLLLNWARDNLYRLNKENTTLHTLFISNRLADSAVVTGSPPEHYVVALQERMDTIGKLLAIGEIDQKPAFDLNGIDFQAPDHLEAALWINELKKISQFRSHWRQDLYVDSELWKSCFSITSGIVDSFTLSLKIYTDLYKYQRELEEEKAKEMGKSVLALIRFIMHQSKVHPLFLLDRHPHLATLRVTPCQSVSKLRGFVDYHLQLAIRACILQQAKESIFLSTEDVLQTQYTLGSFILQSRKQDTQGNVKHTITAALCSLMNCHSALKSYISHSECSQLDSEQVTAELVVLQRGIEKTLARLLAALQKETKALSLPTSVWKKLQDFVDTRI